MSLGPIVEQAITSQIIAIAGAALVIGIIIGIVLMRRK